MSQGLHPNVKQTRGSRYVDPALVLEVGVAGGVGEGGRGGGDSTTRRGGAVGGEGEGRATTVASAVVMVGFKAKSAEGGGLATAAGGENEISAMAVPATNPKPY